MSKIKCIVVDDEAIARTAMAEYVRRVDALELCGVFKNALDANEFLQKNDVELLFLDIEMPKLSGIQFLRIFNKDVGVIFTTAYTKFALESFDFNVIDYLLKPISFERFLQAVNKAIRYFGNEKNNLETDFVFIKDGTKLRKIVLAEIDFVEAMQNYIRIFFKEESVMTLMTLKEFLTQLPPEKFIQTHRSFLVNIQKIEKVEEDKICFGKHRVPISKRNRAEVLKRLKK